MVESKLGTSNKHKNKSKRFWKYIVLVPLVLVVVITVAFFLYTSNYYHATEEAKEAMKSGMGIEVDDTDYGYFLDGPGEEDCMIFYPGAKVEASAYVCLLRKIAEQGMDVCLVEMPFNLAIFGQNKADEIIDSYNYDNWYIGGHSMGGAMAAIYASENDEKLKGLVLLAAYPTKKIDDNLTEISIYGSEDLVLNKEKVEEGKKYSPNNTFEYIIEGGNHAQFGNYGIQKGDGKAEISAKEQQELAAEFIVSNIE